jgi:hypothetical protein
MDYGNIITRAWNITWNNKFLWVLGFLAALTSAGSNSNSFQQSYNQSDFANNPELFMAIGAAVLVLTCVFLIIGLILWLLSIAARGGLIDGVNRIDDGEAVTLKEAFSAGFKSVWRLIGVYILAFLPLIIISIVVGIIAVMAIGGAAAMGSMMQNPDEAGAALVGSLGLLGMCLCLAVCALIPLTIVLSFIAEFAIRGVMIQNMGVLDSLSHGWRIFKENLGPVIILSLLLFVIGIMVSFVLGMIMIPLSLMLFAPTFISLFNDGMLNGIQIVYAVGSSLLLAVVGAALMAVVQTWSSAVWTLAYKEFTGKSPDAIPAEKLA